MQDLDAENRMEIIVNYEHLQDPNMEVLGMTPLVAAILTLATEQRRTTDALANLNDSLGDIAAALERAEIDEGI